MPFEIRDLLTPIVTLLAVWLAAQFTLNHEIRKKELEIRVDRLEKLSADCDEVLDELINYAGFINGLLQAKLLLVSECCSKDRISIDVFSEWQEQLDSGPLAPDWSKKRRCEHGLRFHHYREWQKWNTVVPVLRSKVYDFFMVTPAGEVIKDQKNQYRTLEECEIFIRSLRKWQDEATLLRNELIKIMSNDFHRLTQSKSAIFFK